MVHGKIAVSKNLEVLHLAPLQERYYWVEVACFWSVCNVNFTCKGDYAWAIWENDRCFGVIIQLTSHQVFQWLFISSINIAVLLRLLVFTTIYCLYFPNYVFPDLTCKHPWERKLGHLEECMTFSKVLTDSFYICLTTKVPICCP